LIGRGSQRLLIDTGQGMPRWPNLLQSVLQEEKATVQKALLTHWHHDHVQGVPDLLKICPQATVYKHMPEELGDGETDIHDGQVFKVEGATLRAFHTPGHTVDHMSFVFEEEDAIFTGDSKWSPLAHFFLMA
jgi:glyoxylase-like metal-dependent hydrolase (beta-lactamase superfamily II)